MSSTARPKSAGDGAGMIRPLEGDTVAAGEQAFAHRAHESLFNRLRLGIIGWSLSAPAIILMILLLLAPVAAIVWLSGTDYLFGAKTFNYVGFENYEKLLEDRIFWKALRNTFAYTAVVVPFSFGLGLFVAIMIQSGVTMVGFYRAAYFLPVTASILAMAIVWEFMLMPNIGLINLILDSVGAPMQNFLTQKETALLSLAAIGIWQLTGFNMVLFLAGLVAIPRHLYEAAAIDGADSAWERLRLITWPMLGPVSLFVVVISAIRSFQVFDTVEVLTAGGPNKESEVLLHLMYLEGFAWFRTGYAAAITVVFLLFVLLMTLAQIGLIGRRVHYR